MASLNQTQKTARLIDSGDMQAWTISAWVDQMPAGRENDTPQAREMIDQRRRDFRNSLMAGCVPGANYISIVIDNVADHVCGSEPTWVISGGQESEHEEAQEILDAIWNARDLHSVVQDALRPRIREGHGAVRIRIPAGALRKAQGGAVEPITRDPIEIAKRLIRIEALAAPERLEVKENEQTLTMEGEYDLTDQGGQVNGKEKAWVEEGLTVVGVEVGGEKAKPIWRLDLGERLPYIVVKGKARITDGMILNQLGINQINTAAIANGVLAAQISEHFHNLMPQSDGNGGYLPTVRGPGGELYTQDMVAMQTVPSDDGLGTRSTPVILKGEYNVRKPVSSEPLSFNIDLGRMNIYDEASQRAYLLGDKATATGEARKTALMTFFKSLAPYRADAVKMIREMLHTILELVTAMEGRPARFRHLNIEPQLTDVLASPTAEDRRVSIEEVREGIKSRQRARADLGIIDVRGEDTLIIEERKIDLGTTDSGTTTPSAKSAVGQPKGDGQEADPQEAAG